MKNQIRDLWSRILALRFRLFQQQRYRTLTIEDVGGYPFVVLPDVFNPGLFRTGEFLMQQLSPIFISPDSAILDMGCGTGIGAIFAAQHSRNVVAVDINPDAVRCTKINALLNHVENRIQVREGDLFEPVKNECFDLVLFNPPFFCGEPQDPYERAWRSQDVVERFAAALPRHLRKNGRALVVFSSKGDGDAFLQAFRANGLNIETVAQTDVFSEVLTVYRLTIGQAE